MSEYSRIRRELGFSDGELQRITGYTRQGLRYSFELLKNGKKPNPRFFIGVKLAIDEKIQRLEADKQRQIEYYDAKIGGLNNVLKNAEKIQTMNLT